MLKIVTWNVNGIRACAKKGALFGFLEEHQPDILCIQEIKATIDVLPEEIKYPKGYHAVWFPAQKKDIVESLF